MKQNRLTMMSALFISHASLKTLNGMRLRCLKADLWCNHCHVNSMTLDTPKISCRKPLFFQAKVVTDL